MHPTTHPTEQTETGNQNRKKAEHPQADADNEKAAHNEDS
jgi:hypothetical protein